MTTRTADETETLDELFAVLSQSHRRRLLTRLQEEAPRTGAAVPLERVTDGQGIDGATLHLIHADLPKLDAAAVVEWDPERHVVSRGPRFDEVARLLELVTAEQDDLPSN